MIISFAWTTPAVVIGEKTETRRDWSERTIMQAKTAATMFKGGNTYESEAWDKSPRFGGKCFGTIQIIEVIAAEDSRAQMPDSAYKAEGFHILTLLGAKIGKSSPDDVWRFWKEENDEPQTVVKFTLVDLNDYGKELQHRTFEALYKLKMSAPMEGSV